MNLLDAPSVVFIDLERTRQPAQRAGHGGYVNDQPAAVETVSVRADLIVAVGDLGTHRAEVFLAGGASITVDHPREVVLEVIRNRYDEWLDAMGLAGS